MNLFKDFQSIVLFQLEALEAEGEIPAGLDLARVTVEPPRDPSHGDMATNAAMVLALIFFVLRPMISRQGTVIDYAELTGPRDGALGGDGMRAIAGVRTRCSPSAVTKRPAKPRSRSSHELTSTPP